MLHLQQYYVIIVSEKKQEVGEKMRKIITTLLLMNFTIMNIAPVFAIEDMKKSSAAPKYFKSMAKKDKKYNPNYKYEYVNLDWWKNFNDENLDTYIMKAIENNYDLKMATLVVEEYYQQTRASLAKELPSATVGYFPNLMKPAGSTSTTGTFIAPAFVQYEADIFLKNRDKTRSAKKAWEGSKFDERGAYISVVSAVGVTYLNLVRLDKVIALQEEIVKNRKEIYELMLLRHNEGITSTSDTVKANKAYVSGSTDLIELKKQREKVLNQLCVLIGESPENANTLTRTSLDDLKYTGQIPEEIASEIIVQRPDYLKAEKMVEKAGIDVRVAKKEFLPSIILSGALLFNSNQFGSLFTTKDMIGALGGGILLPIFTGGLRIANLRYQKAEYERILQNYYKTNLVAIQEVNDSLVSIKMDEEKFNETKNQISLEKAEYGFNEQRYSQGVISRLDLIQVKENLLVINKLLTNNKVECMVDYIELYKAVGSKL